MPEKIKILLAEDEPSLAMIIKESLETQDFEVIICSNGEEALSTYSELQPKLVVLDIMMPKKNGFEVAQSIRKGDRKTPILFLTAKSQSTDVVEGFNYGGNDYLKKPFSMLELIVRVKALLNRIEIEEVSTSSSSNDAIIMGGYLFNYTKQSLSHNGNIEMLTYREAEVLYYLYRNKNSMVNRSNILNEIWGNDDFFSGRSLDVFITKIRKKLANDKSIQIINSRGLGYKLLI